MIRFIKYIILLPIMVVFAGFMLSNRHSVLINFDPFNSETPFYAIELPLYLVMIGTMVIGILFGGIVDWLNQRKYRKSARVERNKNRKLEQESAKLKDHIATQTKKSLMIK